MKAAIITGATSGLGKGTAELLARDPRWLVVLACRDVERANALAQELGDRTRVVPLDLASLTSIRAFPAALARVTDTALGALVCNAGGQDVAGLKHTGDGFERTFGVNHLGHFLLTSLLTDRLATGARVVVVSSNTHDPATKTGMPAPRWRAPEQLAQGIDDGEDPVVAGRIRYTTSKLCNVYFARELARRFANSDDSRLRSVHVAAFDPGMMPGTSLAREYGAAIRFVWSYVLPLLTLGASNVNTVARSAGRLVRLLEEDASWPSGAYVSEGVVTEPSAEAKDAERARVLWAASELLVAA